MVKPRTRILGISGSLRAASSNNAIIKVVAAMDPANIEFIIYNGVGDLPHFNDNPQIPAEVEDFRRQLAAADGVFICTPEYAFGVPGSLKNALDWTVGTGDFVGKPVALVTASSAGDKAHASLLHTLTAISADIVEGGTLLVPFIRSKMDDKGQVSDLATYDAIRVVLDKLKEAIKSKQASEELS